MFDIPDEHLPDFARDKDRLTVLFAPLRNRTVNPKDFDSKLASWKTLIQLYCIYNNVYSFALSDLNKVFVFNGRSPSCLEVVVQEMIKNGELLLVEVFSKSNPSTWSGWFTDIVVKRPVSWSLTKIRNSFFNPSREENYVHLNVVKNKSEELLKILPETFKNKLISLEELLVIIGNRTSQENVQLLLHNLIKQQKIDITNLNKNNTSEHSSNILIKFGDGQKVKQITDMDLAVYTLEKNEKLLLQNIEKLEDEVENTNKEAKEHLKKGHKQMAKNCIRKRHEIEKRITKKSNALHNVQVLLEQIRDTHSDAHVWESYKQALSAFDLTFKETGLSEDSVDDTMIKLGEMLDLQQDIEASLAKMPGNESESDLEQELADLMKSEDGNTGNNGGIDGMEKQLDDLELNLPDVPTHSPNKSVTTNVPL